MNLVYVLGMIVAPNALQETFNETIIQATENCEILTLWSSKTSEKDNFYDPDNHFSWIIEKTGNYPVMILISVPWST